MSSRISGRRQFWFVVVALTGCLVGIIGTVLFTQSPQQAAQDRAVPVLPVPTALVVKQELVDKSEIPCSFSSSTQETVAPISAGKMRSRVVTSVNVSAGDVLKSGRLVGSVSERPLIAFVTSVPFFRDLSVGDRGADVKALETGLVKAGMLKKADRHFGVDTLHALQKIYRSAGLGSPKRFVLDAAWAVPSGSRVAQVLVRVGDVVAKNTGLITAMSEAGDWVCDLFSENDTNVGDVLEAQVGSKSAKGTVVDLSTDDETGSVSMKVSMSVPSSPADMVVIYLIEAASDGPVLTVPAGAVFTSPNGDLEVRKVSGEESVSAKIEIGVVAGGWVEISGSTVTEGNLVALRGGE